MEDIITLMLLILLQAVLGFDNLLYISLESKRAPEEDQKRVRTLGIAIAIILRIVLLFVLVSVIKYFQKPIGEFEIEGIFHMNPNVHSIIVLLGGIFIIYTAIKEIWHMLGDHELDGVGGKKTSTSKIIVMIVIMNVVFSFDSILSAMALTDVFWVMATAIVISGIMMIWLSGHVAEFLKKNRMYEVLGLFILFVVGIMLLTEGGHIAHIKILGEEITPMSKTTFYFVIFILVVVDVVQGQYQKKLLKNQQKKALADNS
ncbi:MAG: tellurium resistance protein TerC [Flavobacteriales bacterium]|nr:MAG: tellurium resistance protein TerC [Flavobacteriales bacterium]